MTALTLADRRDAFMRAFPDTPAAWPWVVEEGGLPVLYGVWVIGANYKNATRYYGAHPGNYLERVMAFFPDVVSSPERKVILHVFSGSLPPSAEYVRMDVNPLLEPEIVGDVESLVYGRPHWRLVLADPPYDPPDAARYGTGRLPSPLACTNAIAAGVHVGGHLVWLDTKWPMFSKRKWRTVGRLFVVRSTNHRVRKVSIFERVA